MESTATAGSRASTQPQGQLSNGAGCGSSPTDSALDTIKTKLDQSGLFDDVTHSELRDINSTLENLDSKQTNEVISRLSDDQLKTWADEIGSNGIFGTGGLSDDERSSLFNNLANDLEPQQLARVYGAFSDNGEKTELLAAANKAMDTDEVITALADRAANMPRGAARTELEAFKGKLEQMQKADLMARFAKDSYKGYANAASPGTLGPATMRLNPDQLPPQLGIEKTDLIDNASGFYAAVYRQAGASNKYIVAFRGTEDGTDWLTNFGSGIGIKTTQFEMADRLVAKLVAHVGAENVEVTGHSLGGGLANYAALKHEVPSTTFNPKGTTWREWLEIGNENALAAKYIQNYQVEGEVLTGVQEMKNPTIMRLVMEAPGPVTKLPAIKPDGSEGNMLSEAIVEGLMRLSPFHDAGKHNISGPVDRHGMDYVMRGLDAKTEQIEGEALKSLFESYN